MTVQDRHPTEAADFETGRAAAIAGVSLWSNPHDTRSHDVGTVQRAYAWHFGHQAGATAQ